ncbi:MAG: NUDIX hydrolase [Candidatus Competibacter denitrificans]|jgi:8-oxo-dGTP pyrophosphatase MutT (NUDIX family)|uniref:Phosphatase NudJ n=1 Tax=Candidatus Competibacter denitrificans Run_A_D11 TaxID=1400863 RepID=W6M7T6_9GAMM|nr:NUDIX hydrolase [Candidatus Competibacter denitrificans]CDI02659.1 NUDIX hydrolase [Candidatus Competibacter denitrificans Run_A_D11]HAS87587.1 NUDIX hydrolase [Candidatus Competibacteraceae bacterium]HRC70125.1 NUDIX hydrolase [Candidatus Competibacter denitrificans]
MESSQWLPRLTVATIIERDGRFLLVEEYADGEELVYNQPAGHLDEHETLAAAAIRETLEETAWEVQVDAIVGVYYWTHPKGHTFIRTCFAGTALQHHPGQPLDDGIQRALWLTWEEIVALGPKLRSPMVLRCLEDYRSGIRHPLSLMNYL